LRTSRTSALDPFAEAFPEFGENLVRRRPLPIHNTVSEAPGTRERRLKSDRDERGGNEGQRGRGARTHKRAYPTHD